MEDSHHSLSSLLCAEDGSCFDHQRFHFCSVSEHDSEYIQILFRKEEAIFQSNSLPKTETNWRRNRRNAVKWILHKRALFGFQFHTAYLSLIYFDRFYLRRSIDKEKMWAIRLLSIACLSLAAKMEEIEAPSLSEYDVVERSFKGDVIQRMELLVLNTLEWKMSCITPFTYLTYFVTLFCCRRDDFINQAVELIFAIMSEINVMDHRPSVIAAAAVLAAYDPHLTEKMLEIKINDVPSWGLVEKEHTLFCYSLLREIRMSKSNISRGVVLTPPSSGGGVDDSMVRSTVGSKRIRAYNDDDLHCPQTKTPKL